MKKHSIFNLKCPCSLFRYPNLDIPSNALFILHRASALSLKFGSEDDQYFQSFQATQDDPSQGAVTFSSQFSTVQSNVLRAAFYDSCNFYYWWSYY